VDVEIHRPQDLQMAMYYARAFERWAAATPSALPTRAAQLVQRAGLPAARAPWARPATLPPVAGAGAPGGCAFRQLTPAEQQEWRRQGLCYNCDELYAPGHVCQRLLYLAADDIIAEAAPPLEDVIAPALQEEDAAPEANVANVLSVSLHAFAGIRTSNTMLLPVMIEGERLLALLDTGSTHNFLSGATMRRLGLAPDGGEHLRVTVANGDKLRCPRITRNIPITIEGETFTIMCASIDMGCFDFILGYNYLRTLGPITWDLEAKTMAFWRGGRRI
jgi:hypothetical protein